MISSVPKKQSFMGMKDYCFYAKTPGIQVNIAILLAAISFTGFFYTYFASLYWDLLLASFVIGCFLMLGIYFLTYAIIISYFQIKNEYYRK